MDEITVLHDVTFTRTDETFYVGMARSDISDKYKSSSIEELNQKLTSDGWSNYGRNFRWDYYPVTLWTKDNSYIAGWLEIEGLFDIYRLKACAELGRQQVTILIRNIFTDSELEWRGAMMRLSPKVWYEVAEILSDEEIKNLIKFFVLAENYYKGWKAGSVSPVIWLTKALENRGYQLGQELVDWITEKSSNPYLPFGTHR